MAMAREAAAQQDDIPYLARGILPVDTGSSVLVSSSKYQNDPRLREWIAKIALKANGPDFPPAAEMHELIGILADLRDYDRIEELFHEEREPNERLHQWLSEGFVSDYKLQDIATCAPGTLGGIMYEAFDSGSYEVEIVPHYEPKSQWEYYSLRSGKTHDFEHILTGGGFNYMGELVPFWFRLSAIHTHIRNKELAGEMSAMSILGTTRYVLRTMLHYPEVWETALNCIKQGIEVGQQSDAFWMAKMENYWDMPLEDARAALGVRGARSLDTERAGAIWEAPPAPAA